MQSADSLLPAVYSELKRLAAASLSKLPPGQTLQPTALVHDTWLKLVGEADPGWEGRRHFFGAAARAMRELIIDQLRRKTSQKRQAPGEQVEPDSQLQPAAVLPELTDVLAVDAALERLEKENAEAAEVVVLSFYGGLSLPEIAELKQAGLRTIERRWQFARAWLLDALREGA
jgi:RNA polymerase sigma factor (TIGR02999 family)